MVTTLGNRANSLSVSTPHTGGHTHTHTHCSLSKTGLMLFSRFCYLFSKPTVAPCHGTGCILLTPEAGASQCIKGS